MGNPGSPEDKAPLADEELDEVEVEEESDKGDKGGGDAQPDFKYGG